MREFIATRAAFVAQKSAVDYCRGKTGLFSRILFEEKEFQDALAVCRWESFAATLADLLLMTEGYMRSETRTFSDEPVHRRAREALGQFYPEILASYPVPAHRATQGWSDVEAAFTIRFAAAIAASPRSASDIADHSARRMFETLPIHPDMRQLDEEIVHGAVRFRLIAAHQELMRRARIPELIESLATP
ncbi:MAG: hypothetical protein FJW24_00895 [Acidimicrobiia bacterium]|nr:hypothetical protein [Acidimicrobiia bacterium]